MSASGKRSYAKDAPIKERQDMLFAVAGVLSVNNDDPVPNSNFHRHAERFAKELSLNNEARMALAEVTLS